MTDAPLLPHSREAEEALLGSILINPDAYLELADFLQPGDFYIHRHRWIWEACTRLCERRIPLDFLTLADELDRAGQLAEVGGPAFLTALLNLTPTSLNAVAYGQIVHEASLRRRLLSAANEIARAAYQEDLGIEQVLNQAESAVFAVAARSVDRELVPVGSFVGEVFDHVSGSADSSGIPTGFSDLDGILSAGLRPSELVVIAGRPGMGKTGLVLSLVRHAALKLNKRVALFSLEMDGASLSMRLISQESGIDFERIRGQKLKADDWPVFTATAERLTEAPLFIDDTPLLTPMQLRTKCRRLHVEHGLDLVAIDYLQLMNGGGRFENRTQEVAHISRQLKMIARELGVPVVTAAQLSRGVEQRNDKMPQLSDLRESGAIEQDADIVLFLYRNEESAGLTKLRVAKQRNGATGEVDLVFRGHLTRFENAARRPF